MSDKREMPRYKCHKEVHALKIRQLTPVKHDPTAETSLDEPHMLLPDEDGYGEFQVSAEYMQKHRPRAGGYYVVYEDGYVSFSPPEAFESGYTRI